MKESYWGYWLIVLGVFIVVVLLLVQNFTSSNTQDYYLIKSISEGAMEDAIDYGYYTIYNELRMNKEKFFESFLRRFAEEASVATTYDITFSEIFEAPPKISVEVASKSNVFTITGDSDSFDIVNKIDGILELGYGEGVELTDAKVSKNKDSIRLLTTKTVNDDDPSGGGTTPSNGGDTPTPSGNLKSLIKGNSPVEGELIMNSCYGDRDAQTDGATSDHRGIDIISNHTNVYALAAGKVVKVNNSNSSPRGRYVIYQVENTNSYILYQHLSRILVNVNDHVTTGSLIGESGGSGNGREDFFDSHLHLEICEGTQCLSSSTEALGTNWSYNTKNPATYLGDDDFIKYCSKSGDGCASTNGYINGVYRAECKTSKTFKKWLSDPQRKKGIYNGGTLE